jgi:hypothetical protein
MIIYKMRKWKYTKGDQRRGLGEWQLLLKGRIKRKLQPITTWHAGLILLQSTMGSIAKPGLSMATVLPGRMAETTLPAE